MSNPVKTITRSIIIFCLLAGAGVVYKHFTKEPEVKAELIAASSGTKKKKSRKVTPQAGGLAPIIEETEEDEKLDQFLHAALTTPPVKKYLVGLTLGYTDKINYNVLIGKAVTEDCYAIAKLSTDFSLSKAEAGALCRY